MADQAAAGTPAAAPIGGVGGLGGGAPAPGWGGSIDPSAAAAAQMAAQLAMAQRQQMMMLAAQQQQASGVPGISGWAQQLAAQQKAKAMGAAGGAPGGGQQNEPGNRIYIGGIHENTTKEQVQTVFEACGTIKDIVLVTRKGFGFVEYEDLESAAEAVKYHGWTCSLIPNIHDEKAPSILTVKYAKPRDPRDEEREKQKQERRRLEEERAKNDPEFAARLEKRKRPRTPSPDPMPRYSRRVAVDVGDDLKAGGINYGLAVRTLSHWLSTGETDKNTRDSIHALLKVASAGLDNRLKVFETVSAELDGTWNEIQLSEAVFKETTKPRVSECLTKQQRSYIKGWAKQVEALKVTAEIAREKMARKKDSGPKEEDDMEIEDGGVPTAKEAASAMAMREDSENLRKQLADMEKAREAVGDVEGLKAQLARLKEQAEVAKTAAQQTLEKVMTEAQAKKPPTNEKDAALAGVLAVWLAAKSGGATVDDMLSYLSSLAPHCTDQQVRTVLKANPALFGTLGKAGMMWTFKGYENM